MRGRKPKPIAVKKLAGNPGHRPLNRHAPQFTPLTQADPPAWLDALGKEMWQWLTPYLIEKRVIAAIDLHNVEAFCYAYSQWRSAEVDIRANGLVLDTPRGKQKNPAVSIANDAVRLMTIFGSNLGLDPTSRSRIQVPGGPTKNPFANLDG